MTSLSSIADSSIWIAKSFDDRLAQVAQRRDCLDLAKGDLEHEGSKGYVIKSVNFLKRPRKATYFHVKKNCEGFLIG